MKKLLSCLISAIAAIAITFGIAGCTGAQPSVNTQAYSFVTIDINPSVQLIALGEDVIEVKAANYDACVLLEGEDFSSLTVEQATQKIVALAEQTGYLTDENNGVKITVISDDMQNVEVLKNAAKAGAEKGSKKAEVNTDPRLTDELTLKKLKQENDSFSDLSEEKLRLIESVMEHDGDMTYEKGAKMTVNELSEKLKEAVNETKEIFTSELRTEYSVRYAAAKQEIERNIAAVYGEEYLAAWENYTALKSVYESITDELDKSGMSEDDVQRIAELLNITDVSLIQKGGIVKPEYVLNYIDKRINKKGSQSDKYAVEEVLLILDEYDAARQEITEEQALVIAQAVGEDITFTNLSEISAYLNGLKASLEEIENSVNLTDEQIELIIELKESYADIKQSVIDGMGDLIESARAEIAAQKQERNG